MKKPMKHVNLLTFLVPIPDEEKEKISFVVPQKVLWRPKDLHKTFWGTTK